MDMLTIPKKKSSQWFALGFGCLKDTIFMRVWQARICLSKRNRTEKNADSNQPFRVSTAVRAGLAFLKHTVSTEKVCGVYLFLR